MKIIEEKNFRNLQIDKIQIDRIIGRIIKLVKKHKAKAILLQFPDGLKYMATMVAEKIERETNAKCFIWFESCFGACDLPTGLPRNINLVFSFGHSLWPFEKKIRATEI